MKNKKDLSCEANDQVNRDAASVVPTSESVDGGSGSTPCSFSANDSEPRYAMDFFTTKKGQAGSGGLMTAPDIIAMIQHYKPVEFGKLTNECVELALDAGAITEINGTSCTRFQCPQS